MVAAIDCIELDLSNENQNGRFQEQIQIVKELTTTLASNSTANTIKTLTSGKYDVDSILSMAASSESKSDGKRDVVEEFNRESKLIDNFRNELSNAVNLLIIDDAVQQPKDRAGPSLIFFVDELDRCRPNFAVQLLERIKHLFDIPGIVFVLPIDPNPVGASIRAVYGAEIDAAEYLRRFFNLEFGIPLSDTRFYISSLITRFGIDSIFDERNDPHTQFDRNNFVELLDALADVEELSLREIEKYLTRLRIVMDQTRSNQYLDPVLLVLLIVSYSKRHNFYNQIIDGKVTLGTAIPYFNSLRGAPFPDAKLGQREVDKLHAYLLAAIPDRECADKWIKELRFREDQDATSILEIFDGISEIERSQISLVDIAKKIDLAFWIN